MECRPNWMRTRQEPKVAAEQAIYACPARACFQ